MTRPTRPYDAARRALLADLEAAFAPEAFGRAYPGYRAPDCVSIGGDAAELPFEVIVWPLPGSVTNTFRMAGGCSLMTTEFDLTVGIITAGATDAEASAVALAYQDCIYQVCMADPYLGGLVDYARPQPGTGGGGSDAGGGWVYGANVRVSCRCDVPLNKKVGLALREAR